MAEARRALRRLGSLLAAGVLLLAVAWTALVVRPTWQASHRVVAMFASFAPYAVAAWALGLVLVWGLTSRGPARWLVVPCAAGLVLQAGLMAPYVPHAAPAVTGPRVRVLSINTLYGKAEPDQLARRIADERPDVIVLLEVEEHTMERLAAAGVTTSHPYQVGHAEPGWDVTGRESAVGTLVLSNSPLTELERLPSALGQYVVRVDRPSGAFTLIAAHPLNMVTGVDRWIQEGRLLAEAAQRHRGERLVVAGDLNAVREHLTFRRLAAQGLRDATDASGAGWTPTYAADGPLPALIQIDHVLTNDRLVAVACRAFDVTRTDHRGLVADLVITR